MATAVTERFEEMVLEIEFDPVGAAGTYTKICGLVDVDIDRNSNIDNIEIPDCGDDSLPMAIALDVRSQEVTASGSGVWSLSSHKKMLDWWYSGAPLVVRLRNVKVETDGVTGDPISETGPALLVSLKNARTKGKRVTADIKIQFDGLPVVAVK